MTDVSANPEGVLRRRPPAAPIFAATFFFCAGIVLQNYTYKPAALYFTCTVALALCSVLALRVAKVINCTGPRTDYSKYQHPLLINLLAAGLIGHDPLALGIDALPSGEVRRHGGAPTGWLFTIGAPLKATLWESTAVPEIRAQAGQLAGRLLAK